MPDEAQNPNGPESYWHYLHKVPTQQLPTHHIPLSPWIPTSPDSKGERPLRLGQYDLGKVGGCPVSSANPNLLGRFGMQECGSPYRTYLDTWIITSLFKVRIKEMFIGCFRILLFRPIICRFSA